MVPQIKPDLTVKNILRLERHNWVTGTGMARISREGKEVRMKVYIGIDWSENKHDVCFLKEMGEVLLVQEIRHTIAGFRQLDQARQSLGVERQEVVIGLETAHNLLVDYLWDQGYEQIYVLPPSVVKSAQKRYRQSGAKDDAWDARLIANLLRTDRARYRPWKPDQPLTRQIRAEVRFAIQLGQELVRHANRLRSILLRYYPAVLEAFPHLDSVVGLAFVQTYPTPQQAQALSFEQLKVFLREHHHTQSRTWPGIYAGLHTDHPQSSPELEAAYSPLASAQARILEILLRSRSACLARLEKLFLLHPDHQIYDSLPHAGALLAPALLAKLGDDRTRYPTAAVLQAVAGTCPVTNRSGKHIRIYFRTACDHEFRHIAQQWARLTLGSSPWAATYYRSVRPHCKTDSDAIRRLANRWLEILWKLWMDRKPYDEVFHLRQHTTRSQIH
jgi:transposase